jgi:hypothetical protein
MGLIMFESTGVFLMWLACTYFFVQITLGTMDALKEVSADVEDKLKKRIESLVHIVRAEEDKDMLYWYDRDNNAFLAQGASSDEIAQVLKSRYPQHLFFLDSPDGGYVISAKTEWKPKPILTSVDQKSQI